MHNVVTINVSDFLKFRDPRHIEGIDFEFRLFAMFAKKCSLKVE